MLQCFAAHLSYTHVVVFCRSCIHMLQCFAAPCSVLQRVAACCSAYVCRGFSCSRLLHSNGNLSHTHQRHATQVTRPLALSHSLVLSISLSHTHTHTHTHTHHRQAAQIPRPRTPTLQPRPRALCCVPQQETLKHEHLCLWGGYD